MKGLEWYCKQVCPWCDDGLPIVHADDGLYFHDARAVRTSPDADPYLECEASPIRAADAEAVAEERERLEAVLAMCDEYYGEYGIAIRSGAVSCAIKWIKRMLPRARAAASAEEEA